MCKSWIITLAFSSAMKSVRLKVERKAEALESWKLNTDTPSTLFLMVRWWAVPATWEIRQDLERASDTIISDLHLANAVGDESQKWILTFSHSPSVIKPSQAMGTCEKCSASDALWVRYAVGRLVNRPNQNSSKRRWSLCCDAIDVQSSGTARSSTVSWSPWFTSFWIRVVLPILNRMILLVK